MPSLRDAIQSAQISLQEQVAADAVKRLRQTSKEVAEELRGSYSDFFQVLHERVLNSASMDAARAGLPAIFKGSEIAMRPWHAVTPRWHDQKSKAYEAGDFRALDFYHGVTDALVQTRRNRRGQFKKKRSNLSLDQFIQSLAMGGETVVSGFFGPMKIAYEVSRPDKGVVHLTQINDAVSVIRQWAPNNRFTSSIDGTVIKTTITAFPKLLGINNEAMLLTLMESVSGHREQWVKIRGSKGVNRIRAVILPLVNWYMKRNFHLLLEERFR